MIPAAALARYGSSNLYSGFRFCIDLNLRLSNNRSCEAARLAGVEIQRGELEHGWGEGPSSDVCGWRCA